MPKAGCRTRRRGTVGKGVIIEAQATGDSRSAASLDPRAVTTVLCDADGTLFPSEEPAYVASAVVTQAFADHYGLVGDFSAQNLRRIGTGRNFRAMAEDLLRAGGAAAEPSDLEQWVERERVEVTAYLAATLTPQAEVLTATAHLGRRFRLAVISSSALSRLAACFTACGLDETFPESTRFSAEDSLSPPISKPDPAVYLYALEQLGVRSPECVAIEDSVVGVRASVSAGIATVGIVQFVPAVERAQRVDDLYSAGAALVAQSWDEVTAALTGPAPAGSAGIAGRTAAR
jgi:beta-phosphoglucomutase-like phosphatase (HAD superfamily)